MAKFTKSELKKSVIDGVTLMEKENEYGWEWQNDFTWVEYHEIKNYIDKGYMIFNEEKREYYEKLN